MKKRILPVALIAAAITGSMLAGAAKKATDPTVMTVNGKAIPLSEFSYLYNKNNSQQVAPQTVDEYLDMFIKYKLKVADAEATGVDTTAAFRAEFNRYRDELAQPYMVDSNVQDSLVNVVLGHMMVNRNVDYIMMFGGRTPEDRDITRARLDSIRGAIVNGTGDFTELANRFSVDKNGGHMGYMPVNRLPYVFEDAVYTTPVGQVSEVKELPGFGYFIVKVVDERPDKGQVEARHILKLTKGLSDEEKAVKKAQIDSIYNVLLGGGKFEVIARRESEDPGSAGKGGMLGWFGAGAMVPEFENVCYSLADGELSAPFETSYGYHIVQRLGFRPFNVDEVRPSVVEMMKRDSRGDLAASRRLDSFKKEYGAKIDTKVLKDLKKSLDKAGIVDSLTLSRNKKVVITIGNEKFTVADVAAKLYGLDSLSVDEAYARIERTAGNMLNFETRQYAMDHLGDANADYRNLINEYRDGMLLFEVSNANVWERSTTDTEGLEKYFNAHRGAYTWDKPRYKGYVVFLDNDSVGNIAKEYFATATLHGDDLVKAAREKFGRHIKIERVLAAQGENQIVDHVAFDGPVPTKVSKQWPFFFAYGGAIIAQPEEAADVKGLVTADYQQVLETQWLDELRKKYPVVVDHDVLKLVK